MNTAAPASAPTLTVAGHSFDPATIPQTSLMALLRRGLTHYLNNEQASKVSTAKAKALSALAAWDASAEAERTTARPEALSEEQVSALMAEHQAEAVKAIMAGTMGQGRGPGKPAVSPLDKLMRDLAQAEVVQVLSTQGLKLPTGEKTITFGGDQAFTRADLIDRRLAHAEHGPRIKEAATKELRARDRAAASAAKAAEGKDVATLLGL